MPLQKTFSNTDHSNRAAIKPRKHNWSRNHTHPAARPSNTATTTTTDIARPLQPVSEATKNKLNVFHFANPNKQTTSKSSQSPTKDSTSLPNHRLPHNALLDPPPASDASERQALHSPDHDANMAKPPMTPIGRLAFNDLVSMADMRTPAFDRSPDERIMWAYDYSEITSSIPSAAARPLSKRARSSSPVSTPACVSAHFHSKAIHNGNAKPLLLQNQSQSNSKDVAASNLFHILGPSSPQSSKRTPIPKSDGKLRRSMTCGLEWPKRRKIATADDPSAGDSIQVATPAESAKLSRISALLEQVHDKYTTIVDGGNTLHKPPSPCDRYAMPSTSIHQGASMNHVIKVEDGAIPPADDHGSDATVVANEADDLKEMSGSSDYGDFDDDEFDVTLVDHCQQKHTVPNFIPPENNQETPHSATPFVPVLSANQSSNQHSAMAPGPIIPDRTVAEDSDDEFGEGDDMDDELLQGIASKFDTPVDIKPARDNGVRYNMNGKEPCLKASDLDDEFGDDLDDIDFDAMESAATQSLHTSITSELPSSQKARVIQRYLVNTINEYTYTNDFGRQSLEKVLFVSIDKAKTTKTIRLRDGWFDTPVTELAYVHVIGDFVQSQIIITDAQNMLILHPDHLISSTVVADSFSCIRRAVLQDRVKATNDTSEPLVYGTILHEIFQAAIMANQWDSEWLATAIHDIASRHMEELYIIRVQVSQAVEYLSAKMPELQAWAELFVSSKVKPDAILKANNNSGKAAMCISKLLDVEEHVWSPMYGLKGNIDATVQVTIREGDTNQTLTVPFEVKTGKRSNAAHRAQTALYNLLLSDRYDVNVACGILYYMETSETIRIPAIRHEVRHMIMQRNELACFVRERHAQLPPMLKSSNMCGNCYAKVPCFIYSKFADEGSGEASGLKNKFDEVVKHLTPQHQEFFMRWDDLLTKEEKESMKFRRELWTMLSTEREKLGRCFSNVQIEPGSAHEDKSGGKINRFQYTLIKPDRKEGFSFHDSQMTVGEPIVVSDEMGHFALANGYVSHVNKRRITIAVDRRLHNARVRQPGFHEVDNQVFTSIMDLTETDRIKASRTEAAETIASPISYRLDKDEFSNGMATVRNNLIQLMSDIKVGSRTIRSLVVDLTPPKFKPSSTNYVLQNRTSINIDQRRAIHKVMTAQDYALILGMPGTGKTTTIAHIIRALVSQGKSVLLTSYTHTAVDNILLKLKDDKMPILRLGAAAKIHPEVQDFVTIASKSMESFEDIQTAWHGSPVVATTCLGINHPIFSERTFNYCIVDEASQITLPVCLGPIRLAQAFILVGDHYQLPPLVQNEEARTGGLDVSLFKLLSDAHPAAVANLEHQYRMCADVQLLSNELIYSGRLKCGTPDVASRSLQVPNMAALDQFHRDPHAATQLQRTSCIDARRGQCWIRDMLDPSIKVRFLNLDNMPDSRETNKGNRIVNHTEVGIVKQLVESLLSVGIDANCIGVMTHYRSQLSVLKEALSQHKDVEMHTADRFQGRDKEVIILSLVRSNDNGAIGELLKDWRRINVAFTRAKTKLLVIGSKSTLKGSEGSEEMVARFIRLMEDKRWVFDLPADALGLHTFEEALTQFSGLTNGHGATGTQEAGTIAATITRSNKRELDITNGGDLAGREKKSKIIKKAVIGQRGLLSGRPILKDIVRDLGAELQA